MKKIILPVLYAFISFLVFDFLVPYLGLSRFFLYPWFLFIIPILGSFTGIFLFKYLNKMHPSTEGAILYVFFIFLEQIYKYTISGGSNYIYGMDGILVIIKNLVFPMAFVAAASYLIANKIFFRKEGVEVQEIGVSGTNKIKRVLPNLGIILIILFISMIQVGTLFCGMGDKIIPTACLIAWKINTIWFPLGTFFVLGLLIDIWKPWISVRIKQILTLIITFAVFLLLYVGY
jgi:hypothetical protein